MAGYLSDVNISASAGTQIWGKGCRTQVSDRMNSGGCPTADFVERLFLPPWPPVSIRRCLSKVSSMPDTTVVDEAARSSALQEPVAMLSTSSISSRLSRHPIILSAHLRCRYRCSRAVLLSECHQLGLPISIPCPISCPISCSMSPLLAACWRPDLRPWRREVSDGRMTSALWHFATPPWISPISRGVSGRKECWYVSLIHRFQWNQLFLDRHASPAASLLSTIMRRFGSDEFLPQQGQVPPVPAAYSEQASNPPTGGVVGI